ncbi:AI-2E family transporter [Paenibacillus ginsengarvi]|uniref:AI-2E family transporter n=1 Tax=Paenibacillus ginsengarvi TaxID=400777 RepID=A0A3B0C2L2_9BACL|nr:AI-2E family transporter [Paenibacillus ginsengarvi]RKN78951.1 AI-2E family transporter [Paenibacillus ginsengarvi]
MPQSKFFRIGYGILLVFLIVWVGVKISFIFYPLKVLVQTLFSPILISGILFYLFRPLVNFLTEKKLPKSLAILVVYLFFALLMTIIVIFVAPVLKRQFTELINSMPGLIQTAISKGQELTESEWFTRFTESFNVDFDKLSEKASDYLVIGLNLLSSNFKTVIGFVANVFFLAVTVPFILFYLLRDGDKIRDGLLKLLPQTHKGSVKQILSKMDETVSLYIRGQIIVAFVVGVLCLLGYLIIGIDYAFLLALAAMITNVIPYVGAFLAAVPAILVAMVDSPFMVVKVIIVCIIAQQIEGNLISPQIMGKQLEIHPLTILLLLLVVGSLVGPLGMLLAVPVYAVAKIIVVNLYGYLQLRFRPPEE